MKRHAKSLRGMLGILTVLGALILPASVRGQEGASEVSTPPGGAAPSSSERLYSLNYEAAPLGSVVRDVMEILGLPYIADPSIDHPQLTVTLRTTMKFAKDDLIPILETVCQLKGFVIRRSVDSLYLVEPASARAPGTLPLGPLAAEPGLVLQVVPLRYISQNDVATTLTPFVSKSATVVAVGRNSLLVAGYPKEQERLQSIISLLDVAPTDRKLFTLEKADPETVVEQLKAIFAYETTGQGSPLLQFVAIPYLRAVLVTNSSEALLPEVEKWIQLLDQEPMAQAYRTYYYEAKARPASHLAELVQSIYGEVKGKIAQQAQAAPGAAPPSERQPRTAVTTARTTTPAELYVTADNNRNMVIIYTTPEIFEAVQEAIRELDQPPRQVLIEVMVAEVTLTKDLELGLEWAIKHGETPVQGLIDFNAGLGSVFGRLEIPEELGGLNYLVTQTEKFIALIHALESENRLHIISSPSLLASAPLQPSAAAAAGQAVPQSRIEVVDQVPVVTTSVSEGQILESVEYKDAGVKLYVTPQAIWENAVNLTVKQEVSQPVEVEAEQKPAFFSRALETTVTIQDGQTLVIGGLIQRSSKMVRTGIPVLSHIPLLHWLFEYRTPTEAAKELVVVLTPRVISTPEQAQEQSKDAMEFIDLLTRKDFGGDLSLRRTLRKR